MLGLVSNSGPPDFRSIHLGLGLGLGPNLIIDRELGGPEPDTSAVMLFLPRILVLLLDLVLDLVLDLDLSLVPVGSVKNKCSFNFI